VTNYLSLKKKSTKTPQGIEVGNYEDIATTVRHRHDKVHIATTSKRVRNTDNFKVKFAFQKQLYQRVMRFPKTRLQVKIECLQQ
jgi:hypothetical protein